MGEQADIGGMLSYPMSTDGNRCPIDLCWGREIRYQCQRHLLISSRSRVKGKSIDQLGIDSLKGLLQLRNGSIQRGICILDLQRVWRRIITDGSRRTCVRSLLHESLSKQGADKQDREQEDEANEHRM